MATAFQPRPLSDADRIELQKAKQKLDKAEADFDRWSKKVEDAPIGSEEKKEAKEQQAIYLGRVKDAQTALDKLNVDLGQSPPVISQSASSEVDLTERIKRIVEAEFSRKRVADTSVASSFVKRLAVTRQDFEVDVGSIQIPAETRTKLAALFGDPGLDLADPELENLWNEPKFHAQNHQKPTHVTRPKEGDKEDTVSAFLCYLFALVLGKDFYVNEIHTVPKFEGSLERPDHSILLPGHGDFRLAVDSNLVTEVKIDSEFGKERHCTQSEGYGLKMCLGYFFENSFVILASDKRIRFMKIHHNGETDPQVSLSCEYRLGVDSDGLYALKGFVQQARSNMQPNKLPVLKAVSTDSSAEPLVIKPRPEDLKLLVLKNHSRVWGYCGAQVLKQVAGIPQCYDTELRVLKKLGESEKKSNHLATLAAHSANPEEHFLLISPQGNCSLGSSKSPWHRFNLKKQMRLFKELDGALDHLHSLKLVHRDVRPDNVIICGHPDHTKLVLIDFGLAAELNDSMQFVGDEFEGVVTFAPDSVLLDTIGKREIRWSPETDKASLVLTAMYVTSPNFEVFMREAYQSLSDPEDLARFLEQRKEYIRDSLKLEDALNFYRVILQERHTPVSRGPGGDMEE